MTLPISLSAAAKRTNPSSISHLMQTALENPGIVSLAAGFVDQRSLPVEMVAQAASDLLGDPIEGRRSLQYGTTIGDLRLRSRLIEYLEKSEGRPKGSYKEAIPRTVVTTGSAQLIYLVCEALLDPGDIVLVESPTYFVFLGPVETRGARAIRIPIDDGGLRLDRLEATLAHLESKGELEPGQDDLYHPRARQSDRDQPGRRAAPAPLGPGPAVVEKASHFRAGGCRLPRFVVRSQPSRRVSGVSIAKQRR